jgi:predicted nucleotidyltransferase
LVLSREDAVALAARLLAARYPQAEAGLAAGSFIRGGAVEGSDLDFVVLMAAHDRSWRESLVFEGVPVDVFVHDAETLRLYWRKDIEAGKPAMLTMTREGVVVGPNHALAEGLKVEAEAIYAAGLPALDAAAIDRWRMLLTDRMDDLKNARPWPELMATGVWLHMATGDFVLRANQRWGATAKWVPRTLAAFDPALADAHAAAFEAFFARREAAAVIAFVEDVLAPFGGPLFDGYRADGEGVKDG